MVQSLGCWVNVTDCCQMLACSCTLHPGVLVFECFKFHLSETIVFFVFVKSQDFSWAKQDASEKNAHQFALSDEKHQEVCA